MSPEWELARTLSSVLYIRSSTPQHPYPLFLPKNADHLALIPLLAEGSPHWLPVPHVGSRGSLPWKIGSAV